MESTEPYNSSHQPVSSWRTQIRGNTGLLIAVIAVAVVIAIGAFLAVKSRHAPVSTSPHTSPQPSTTQPAPAVNTDSGLATYNASGQDINLSFSYPTSWTAVPATGTDTTDAPIIVTSPAVSLTDANGATRTGKIALSIRPGGSALSELSGGKATAAQNSVQIAYTKPTTAQHQYPYISFVHVSGSSNPGSAFEEVFISGVITFSKDQSVVPENLTQLDPIISARFYACATTACPLSDNAALSLTNTGWTNDNACKQLLNLFESLQIR